MGWLDHEQYKSTYRHTKQNAGPSGTKLDSIGGFKVSKNVLFLALFVGEDSGS